MDENTELNELENAENIEISENPDNQNTIFKCEFSEKPIDQYKYAEIVHGRIVSLHHHFMPLNMFRRLFQMGREEDFIDITPAESAAGFEAQIGDFVYYNDNGTLMIERPVYPDTVDGAMLRKLDELKLNRDKEEVEVIEVEGFNFDYDDKARERINAAIVALDVMGEEATIEWTLADDTSTEVTANFLRMVIASIAQRSAQLHIKYRTLKEQIQSIANNNELSNEEKVRRIYEVSW